MANKLQLRPPRGLGPKTSPIANLVPRLPVITYMISAITCCQDYLYKDKSMRSLHPTQPHSRWAEFMNNFLVYSYLPTSFPGPFRVGTHTPLHKTRKGPVNEVGLPTGPIQIWTFFLLPVHQKEYDRLEFSIQWPFSKDWAFDEFVASVFFYPSQKGQNSARQCLRKWNCGLKQSHGKEENIIGNRKHVGSYFKSGSIRNYRRAHYIGPWMTYKAKTKATGSEQRNSLCAPLQPTT